MPDFSLDDDGLDDQPQNPMAQLRDHAKSLEKQLKDLKKEAEELRAFKAQQETQARTASVSEKFEALGLKPQWARFFPSEQEPTPEAIRQFAVENGFAETAELPPPAEQPFRPVTSGGNPSSATVTYEQYQEMLKTSPAEALQAVADGRVEGLQTTPR